MKTINLLIPALFIAVLPACKNGRGDDTHMDTGTSAVSPVPPAVDNTKTVVTDSAALKKDTSAMTNPPTAAVSGAVPSPPGASESDKEKPAKHTAAASKTATANKQPSLDNRFRKTSRKGRIVLASLKPNPAETIAPDKEGVYNRAETMPAYPGGEDALRRYIENTVQYPDDAMNNSAEGTVKVSFVVDEKGRISNPKAVSVPIGSGLEEEAVRVVRQMPKWTPGQVGGHPVKTRLTLPITYKIE